MTAALHAIAVVPLVAHAAKIALAKVAGNEKFGSGAVYAGSSPTGTERLLPPPLASLS